jgi:acetoin utilization deacetylase AcuC-like enzyme
MTKIFYDQRQSVAGIESYSPSAGKPERLVALAARYGFDNVSSFEPITRADLALVHTPGYIDGIFSRVVLNGFENNDPRVPEACLWTIGSLLAAARYAIANPPIPVLSPTSGFHHAHASYGGGFCTFNGLAVVSAILIRENPGIRIGILDCDMHTGDGTQAILAKHDALQGQVKHITQGPYFEPGDDGKQFAIWLTNQIRKLNDFQPDVVLYQAGADPHINDPLGGLLTSAEIYHRDKAVFDGTRAPICFNLAGGYQANPGGTIHTDPVLRIHLDTIRAAEASIPIRKHFFKEAACPSKIPTQTSDPTHSTA